MVLRRLVQGGQHPLRIADLFGAGGEAGVHRVDLAGVDAGLAVKAQGTGHLQVPLQALFVVDVREHSVLGGDTGGPAGHEDGVAGIEDLPAGLGALGAQAGSQVLGPDGHGRHTGAGLGNLLGVHHAQIGLDVAPQLDAAHGQTGGLLDLGDPLVDALHLFGILHLGQADGIGLGTDDGLQVLVQILRVQAVHPDHHILVLGALILHQVIHQEAGRVLLPRGHRVLQVVDDAVLVIKASLDHLHGAGAAGVQGGTHQFTACHGHPPLPSCRRSLRRGRWRTGAGTG